MLKNFKKIFIIVGAVMLFNPAIYAITSEFRVVNDTYNWFNKIATEERIPFSKEDVAKYFSNGAKMITNNKLVCEGIQEHYDHFVELNKHFKSLQVNIDSIDWQKEGDRIYLHYLINAKDLNNQTSKIYVMGYMVVENEKIVLFNEIIHQEKT